MRRLVESAMEAWADGGCEPPLLVTGVRGCGKTHTVREFVSRRFDSCTWASIEDGKVVLYGDAESEGPIVFDGIHTCDDATVCDGYVRSHREGSRFIVLSSTIDGFGDGFANLGMHPLSFSEFLSAMGRDDLFSDAGGDDAGTRDELGRLFVEFTEVGGMPEAVIAWKGTHDGAAVDEVLERTISEIILDSYSEGGAACGRNCEEILRSIPGQLSRRNKKFMPGRAVRGSRYGGLHRPLRVLESHGAVRRVGIVLEDGTDPGFKLFCCDTGILRVLSGMRIGNAPQDGDGLCKGIAENSVLLEVVKNCHADVWCWRSGNRAEAELVFGTGGHRVAVEIDPEGTAYARSLCEYLRTHPDDTVVHMSPDPPEGLHFARCIPLYAASSICALLVDNMTEVTVPAGRINHRKAGIPAQYTGTHGEEIEGPGARRQPAHQTQEPSRGVPGIHEGRRGVLRGIQGVPVPKDRA